MFDIIFHFGLQGMDIQIAFDFNGRVKFSNMLSANLYGINYVTRISPKKRKL